LNAVDDLELCSIDSADWPRDGHIIMNQTVGLLMLALLAAIERTRAHGHEAHAIARLPLVENELRQLSVWIEILMQILRLGRQVSRSSVQRLLRETKPRQSGTPTKTPAEIQNAAQRVNRSVSPNQEFFLQLA